jgi:peroxiredoxin
MTVVGVGDEAPDFSLRDQHGQDGRLSSFRGRQAVVLLFFPYAFSRVCTGELRDLRDGLPDLDPREVLLLGISCDPMYSLRAFAEQEGVTFPLLSDFWPHGEVARSYGVLDPGGFARRSTFVVDREGIVRWSVHNSAPTARDLGELARAVADVAAETPSRDGGRR